MKRIIIGFLLLACVPAMACETWVDGICVDDVIIQTQATDCSPYIDEGWVCWDTDDDDLYIGDGTTAISGGIIGGAISAGDATFTTVNVTGKLSALDATFDSISVGGDASASFSGTGDIYATSGIKAMEGLFAEAGFYGAGLEILDNDIVTTYTNALTRDATFTAATKVLEDTSASFDSTYKNQFMRIISSTPSMTGATAEITEVLSGTQVVLSMATAGGDALVDATGMMIVVYPHPRFFVGDNGVISASIGVNEDAKFEVHIEDGQGFHGMYVEDTAGVDQHQGLTVDTDVKGFDGIVGHNIYMETSVESTDVSLATTSLEINEDLFITSDLSFIDVRVIGDGTFNDIDVIHAQGLEATDHIVHIGQPNTIERAYYDDGDGTTTDVTTGFTSQGTDVTLFENDNSIIYVANETEEFTFIGLAFSTESNRNINAEYYYCAGDNDWKVLPNVTDTTDGCKTSGSISFANPSDRGTCDEEIDSTAFADTTDRAYIAIKRTRNNWSGDYPIENLISIGGATYLYMDSYGTKPIGCDGAPYACTASEAGMTYYDSTAVALLWCDGATWNEFAETEDITVHNNLSGLQGGTATEYYHLTSSEQTELNGWLDNVTLGSTGNITAVDSTFNTVSTTGQIRLSNGAVEAPALSFFADTDIGLYYIADFGGGPSMFTAMDGEIYTSLRGSPYGRQEMYKSLVMRDDVSFLFGNGPDFYMMYDETTDDRLELSDGTNMFLTVKDQGTTADIAFNVDDVFIKNDGNVGIGTTTPTAILHTIGNAGTGYFEVARLDAGDGAANSGGYLSFGSNVFANWIRGKIGANYNSATSWGSDMTFSVNSGSTATSSLDAMTIIYDGNVGIGVTDPDTKLEIIGGVTAVDATFSGNVGIGTTTPSTRLEVEGDVGTQITVDGTTGSRTGFFVGGVAKAEVGYGPTGYGGVHPTGGYLYSTDSISFGDYAGANVMYIGTDGATSGNVGIGTTTPSQMLEVTGNISALDATFTNIKSSISRSGATAYIQDFKTATVVVESIAAADDDVVFFQHYTAVQVLSVGGRCVGTCTDPAQITLEDDGGNAMTHNVPGFVLTGVDATFSDVTAGGVLNAGEGLAFDVDNTPDPETDTMVLTVTWIPTDATYT